MADILGRHPRVVSEIINGKRTITPETAKGLAAALGTSPEYWLNLEAAYQLWHVRVEDDDTVARKARFYSIAPLKELLRRGWIDGSDNIDVLEKRVADLYEVSSLDGDLAFTGDAARQSTPYTSKPTPAQNAWLFRARKLARALQVGRFSKAVLEEALGRLRLLLHAPPEIRHVPRILSDAGIRLVIVEALPGSRIDGASFWIGDSPVIALSLRFDRIDWFWHTLMHELGHVRNGDALSIDTERDTDRPDEEKPKSERLADAFAVVQLVPQQKRASFIARIRPLYSALRIEAFATTCQVHPGIVVGQLHHRGEISWANLRKMLAPVRGIISQAALTDGWGAALSAQL